MPNPLVRIGRYLAEEFAREIKAAVEQRAPTARIATAIKTAIEVEGETRIKIAVGVDLDKAPEGRAFEYGSGIHSTRKTPSPRQEGSGGKYQITPKNAPALVFMGTHEWVGQVIIVPPMGGGVVHHPGVAPKPYLKPGIQSAREYMKKRIREEFKKEIRLQVRTEFFHGNPTIGG